MLRAQKERSRELLVEKWCFNVEGILLPMVHRLLQVRKTSHFQLHFDLGTLARLQSDLLRVKAVPV